MGKSGYVTLAGRPNVGKSTLLNRLVGRKIAITSPLPQTTRNRVVGVLTRPDLQIIFVDTPGIMREKSKLNKIMVSTSIKAGGESDLLVYMADATKISIKEEKFTLQRLMGVKASKILAINKIDAVKKNDLLSLIDEMNKIAVFDEIFPISARTGDGVDEMVDHIASVLPEGPQFYPDDMVTDQPEDFFIGEIIREKAFMNLTQELPYSTAVVVESVEDKPEGVTVIGAIIYVERESQKGIMIGKGGSMLKKIGSQARAELEERFQVKIYMDLRVKVRDKWTVNERSLMNLGYRK